MTGIWNWWRGSILTKCNILGCVALGLFWGLLMVTTTFRWAPPNWNSFSANIRETTMLPALGLAVVACLVSQRAAGVSVIGGSWRRRAGFPFVFRVLGRLGMATLVGAVFPLFVAIITTFVRATAGSLDILGLLSAVSIIPLFLMLGFVIGVWAPRGWNLLLVVLIWYIIVAATSLLTIFTTHPIYVVSPVWQRMWPLLGDQLNPAVSLYRVLLFPAITFALVGLASARLKGQRGDSRATALAIMLRAAPVAVMVMLGVLWVPHVVQKEVDAPYACDGNVCVHAANSAILDNFSNIVHYAFDLTGGDYLVGDAAIEDYPGQFDLSFTIDVGKTLPEEEFWDHIIRQVSGLTSGFRGCLIRSGDWIDEEGTRNLDLAERLSDELFSRIYTAHQNHFILTDPNVDRIDLPPSNSGLAFLTDAELRVWFDSHQQLIRDCAFVDIEELS